jgi:anti-sigma regulatory factor (Ser/Thr protein kinase)
VRRSGTAFSHEALFYDDVPAFLDGTVPFIVEGVEAGDAVMVAVDGAKGDALRAALPGVNSHVTILDMKELGRNPGRIISAWATFVTEHASRGRRVRGIGEPIWHGRSPAEIVECQRHEALLNVAFADRRDFLLLCPYDRTLLHDAVLAEAGCSHRVLNQDGEKVPSAAYHGAASPFAGGLTAPDGRVPTMRLGEGGLPELRRRVAERATGFGLDRDRVNDLVLAVTEAGANTLRHAGGAGSFRVWEDDHSLVCEVLDGGRIEDPLAGRLQPAEDQPSGRGLWLINQLCDLVQIRSSETGTVVRMHMSRRRG